jgi:hypothetical protein
MESELESRRSENNLLKQAMNLLEFENEQLRRALAKTTFERDHHMIKKGELKTLLDSAGTLLVNGVKKFHEDQNEASRREPHLPERLGQLPPQGDEEIHQEGSS